MNWNSDKKMINFKSNLNKEHGHSSLMLTLAIVIIMGLLGYLAFDSMRPEDPSTMSITNMFATWLGWSWWAKGLSIGVPIILLLIGSKLDRLSAFTKLYDDSKDRE